MRTIIIPYFSKSVKGILDLICPFGRSMLSRQAAGGWFKLEYLDLICPIRPWSKVD